MNLQKVEILLNHYFEGKTTIEEEKYLEKFFQQKDIPAKLEKYRTLFSFYATEKKISANENMPELLRGNAWYSKNRVRKLAMAATAAILFSAGLLIDAHFSRVEKQEIYAAYEQTHTAIMKASSYLSKGMNEANEMTYFSEAVEKTSRVSDIAGAMSEMQKLEYIESGYNKTVLFAKYTNYQPFKIK